MTQQTIVVVDDDAKIRALLRDALEDGGFVVREAETGQELIETLNSEPINLITLDINLGKESGLEIAQDIRKHFATPIIMVTGKDDVIDRVVGLEIGADDYITKPFHIRELIARVRSVLRRAQKFELVLPAQPESPSGETTRYHFDGMIAIPDKLQLLDRDGRDHPLTSGDFKLLSILLKRPKRILTREQLMDLIGGHSWAPLDRTIDNQIARLRKKIERCPSEPTLIKTVRGVGYTFACDVSRSAHSPNCKATTPHQSASVQR